MAIQSQSIKQTTTLILILNINPFYILDYPYKDIFQKICFKILTIFKVLGNLTKGPVHVELFPPYALEVLDWRQDISKKMKIKN